VACSGSCSRVGSHPGSNIPYEDYARDDGLFLSVDSSSQCHGNVIQWNFCYRRSESRSDTHSVQFMMYRQRGDTLTYDRLPLSLNVFLQDNLEDTNCTSIPLNSTEQFEIQPNDIIGVCMKDQNSIHPLLVSSFTRREAISVRGISDNCVESQLSSLNFNRLRHKIHRNRNYLLVEVITGKSLLNVIFLSLYMQNYLYRFQ